VVKRLTANLRAEGTTENLERTKDHSAHVGAGPPPPSVRVRSSRTELPTRGRPHSEKTGEVAKLAARSRAVRGSHHDASDPPRGAQVDRGEPGNRTDTDDAGSARADATDCGRTDPPRQETGGPEPRPTSERCNGGGSNAEDRPDCGTVKRRETQPCLRSSCKQAPYRLRKLPRPGITFVSEAPRLQTVRKVRTALPEGVSNTSDLRKTAVSAEHPPA
jgi:hypothetical protein